MNQNFFKLTAFEEELDCVFRKDNYGAPYAGTLCITLVTPVLDFPDDLDEFCRLSVNLPGASAAPPKDAWFGKHWTENEGILQKLEAQGLIEKIAWRKERSGFVDGITAYKLTALGETHVLKEDVAAQDTGGGVLPEKNEDMEALKRAGGVFTLGAVLEHKAQMQETKS